MRGLPPEPFSPRTSRDSARRQVAARLCKAGFDTPDLDARLLVCAASGIDHPALTRDPDRALGEAAGLLSSLVERRLAHEPVSRILGEREFWGLRFAITPFVLDPRPDTEGLIGSVLDAIGGRRGAPFRIVDLGTGSGAILAALLHELPGAYGIGIDRSFEACRQAVTNLARLNLAPRGSVLCGSWADAVDSRFDIVVSNPPYIQREALERLEPEVRCFDPVESLDGGTDGLDAYRAIAARLRSLLAPGGVAAVECGFDQASRVVKLFEGAGLEGVMSYKDLAGHDRVVLGVFP